MGGKHHQWLRTVAVGSAVAVWGLLSVRPAPAQQMPQLADPKVTGPIRVRASPGDTSRAYVFFSSAVDLARYGYIEEEFFIEGRARPYDLTPMATATAGDRAYPYRTRIVVRRPVDARRFNGVLLVEWLNVTAGFDIDIDWLQAHEHLLREGYAWMGVSAQRVGIHSATGLRAWDPDRYGTLDVTAGGALVEDELQYDIFSQAARAARSPGGVRPLGSLTPRSGLRLGHARMKHGHSQPAALEAVRE